MPFCPALGTVYIVGAGPGAPDLLTVRAQAVIAAATLLAPADARAAALLETLAPTGQIVAGVALPPAQLHARLAEHAASGGIAVVLVGGDALRSGAVLRSALSAAGMACELVPGVPAAPALLPAPPATAATLYPVMLTRLKNAPVVVVGGGPVAARKVAGLLAVGAAVRVVSPAATAELRALAEGGRIIWEPRSYAHGDLAGARLAFAATSQPAVNAAVAREADARGVLCNVADAPEAGSFHLPAVHRAPGATIAVSTHGADPAGARRLRDAIARWLAEH